MEQNYKHIIWDWNGTLINDAKISYMLSMRELELCGIPTMPADEYRHKFHHPMKDFYQEIGVDYSKRSYQEITDNFHKNYLLFLDDCYLFEDVLPTLQTIKDMGMTQSILSALPHNILIRTIRDRHIENFFTDISGLATNAADSKIGNAKKWFEKNNFDPSELLMVGDTVHDFEVATALGIDCALIARGCQHKDVLLKLEKPIFDSLDEFVSYLQKSEYLLKKEIHQ